MRPYQWLVYLLSLVAVPFAQPVTLEGVVLRDDTGAPLVSAEVRIAREGDHLLAAHLETDREGRYFVEDLPPGRYTLNVAKNAFLEVTLAVPADFAKQQIRLIRQTAITGSVRAQDGSPLAGAIVYVMERTRSAVFRELRMARATTQSDPDGRYRLDGLPPGNYVLAMLHKGRAGFSGAFYPDNTAPRILNLTGGEDISGCDFIAESRGVFRLKGKVEIPPPAQPAASPGTPGGQTRPTQYSVAVALADQPTLQIAWTTARGDGSFELPPVPFGTYELFTGGPSVGYGFRGNMVSNDNELFFGRTRVQVTTDIDDLVLTVEPSRTVQFQFVSGNQQAGDCPPSLDIRLVPLEAWSLNLERTVTLPLEGVLSVDNLAPTLYAVQSAQVSAECMVKGSVEVNLRNGSPERPVLITAVGKSAISGEVVEREPGAAYQVLLVPLGTAEAMSVQPVDEQGSFRFDSLRPGRYGIFVRYASRSSANLPPAGGVALTEIELLGGQVEILLNAPIPQGATAP